MVTLKPATLRLIRSQGLYVRAYLSDCEGVGTGRPHELYLGKRSITANPSDLLSAPGGEGKMLALYANSDEISRLKRLCVSISGGSMIGATLKTSEIPVAFYGTAAVGASVHP
jgi:hypothetical protein